MNKKSYKDHLWNNINAILYDIAEFNTTVTIQQCWALSR